MSERCDEMFESISSAVDGEIDDDVQASVDVHVAECATCADRQEAVRHLRTVLGEMSDDEPTPGFADETTAWILAQPAPRPRPLWPLFGLLALVLLGISLAWGTGHIDPTLGVVSALVGVALAVIGGRRGP